MLQINVHKMKKEYITPTIETIDIKTETMLATSGTGSDNDTNIGIGDGEADNNIEALSNRHRPGVWDNEW